MARKRYLKKTPLTEARELFLSVVDPTRLATEVIAIDEALDRITAEPVFAKISSPHYHASAMDGIARQPSASGEIRGAMIVAAGLIEGVTFFSLIVTILLAIK